MSTCSTCRPFQLNRSPDYPMTHNARRLRCPTRIHALGEVARAPLILVRPSPSALLCASFHHAIVVARLPSMRPFADHCGPPRQFQTRKSNSRNPAHCYAITLCRGAAQTERDHNFVEKPAMPRPTRQVSCFL